MYYKFSTFVLAAFCCCLNFHAYTQTHQLPQMDQFMGSNFRRTDDIALAKSIGFTREYHDWALDIGYAPNSAFDCQHNNVQYRFNPSFDGATRTNFDALYAQFDRQICPVIYGLSPHKVGLIGYSSVGSMEQLPICNGEEGFTFTSPASVAQEMTVFKDYGLWATLYAVRFGQAEGLSTSAKANFGTLLHPAEQHKTAWAQNRIEYLEIWNEQDKNWSMPLQRYRFTPEQYAAMLSVVYDGHNQAPQLRTGILADPTTKLGVHSNAPNLKVVMGGLSALRGCYVEKMVDWCNQFRPGLDLPFDVVNFHHYSNDYYENPQKSAAYVWDHFCNNGYNSLELQLGSVGNSPEKSGLKERLQYSIQRLIEYDARFINKEFWLSEIGYDIQNTSPQVARVPGITNEEAQAQWLVRTYLEASAAVVTLPNGTKKSYDKLLLYDVTDANSESGALFATSGVYTDVRKGNTPKVAYFNLQTYKNTLQGKQFYADHSVQNIVANGGLPIRVYEYRGTDGIGTLAMWSPTQINKQVSNVKIFLPEGFGTSTELCLTQPRNGSETGQNSAIPVKIDLQSGQKYIMLDFQVGAVLSETPMYISNKPVPPAVPQVSLQMAGTYCNGVRIALTKPSGVTYDAQMKVFIAEGNNVAFGAPSMRLYSNALNSRFDYVYVGGLQADKTYTVWVVPAVEGVIPTVITGVHFFISGSGLNYDQTITNNMVVAAPGSEASWSKPYFMFDEGQINSCTPNSTPITAWQSPDGNVSRASVRLVEPVNVDAVYFYLQAGLGELQLGYINTSGDTTYTDKVFRATSGMHGKWYHIANFANGKMLREVLFSISNDLKIAEARLFGAPSCLDLPAGPPPSPVWRDESPIHDCTEAMLSWRFSTTKPSDFDHFQIQINQDPPFDMQGVADVNGLYQYVVSIVHNQEYTFTIRAIDCQGNASDPLTGVLNTFDCDVSASPCECKHIDLANAAADYWQNTPINPYQMTGNPCSDPFTHGPAALIDEQAKFAAILPQICEGTYQVCKSSADYQVCNASNLANFPSPLSEWFPGWGGAYPFTVRIALSKPTLVNRFYLFDTNGSGTIEVKTENTDGVISAWGTVTLDAWRTWCLGIDDPIGRTIQAIHITKSSPDGLFSEIGLCGKSVGERSEGNILIQDRQDIVVVPNPASDYTELMAQNGQIVKVEVYNMLGQQCDVPINQTNTSQVQLATNQLADGVYLLATHIEGSPMPVVQRLVIRKQGRVR